jgi:hypothetical protein
MLCFTSVVAVAMVAVVVTSVSVLVPFVVVVVAVAVVGVDNAAAVVDSEVGGNVIEAVPAFDCAVVVDGDAEGGDTSHPL